MPLLKNAKLYSLTLGLIAAVLSTAAYADEQDIYNRLDRVERDLITVQKELFQENSRPSNVAGSSASVDTSFEVRLIQIEEQMRQLQGTIEQMAFLLRQKKTVTAPTSNRQAEEKKSGMLTQPQGSSEDDARELYNRAFSYLQKGQYRQADEFLALFLQRHEDHALASNAYYWLGETHYVQRNYEQAAVQFLRGYQKFPKGTKAPDSLLKLAISLVNLKKQNEACTTLEKLLKEFPKASRSIKQRATRERELIKCS